MKDIVNFLFEIGILSKTPRSFTSFLGSGEQSVSEHLTRTAYIGYSLASLSKGVDSSKVMKMCLFHDVAEGRVSDLNWVHQKYVERNEHKAIADLIKTLPFGQDIKEILDEYEERKTPESIIAKDADNLEFIFSLKEQYDVGNTRAKNWIDNALKRLKTDIAKQLASEVMKTSSDEWWVGKKEDEWWVNRGKKDD